METVIYQCPNCGGSLQFDPDTQQYQCEYCQSQFDQLDMDKKAEEQNTQDYFSAMLYHCPSCGAEIVTDDTTAATFCFYCHNPVVLTGNLKGQYQPDQIIPFMIDLEKAMEIFQGWLKKKKYLPSDFFSADQIEKISGVYFPYWLYHCKIDGKLDANGRKRKVWTTGRTEFTETKTYHIARNGEMNVDCVPRNALKKADRRLVDSVLPFNMDQLKGFSMGYLSGFFAEKRDLEKDEFLQEVTSEVKEFAVGSLKNNMNFYQDITVNHCETTIRDEKWSYALFPVWTLTYSDKRTNRIYYFACNGENGKICGELPVDQKKLILLFATIFISVFILMLIMGYLI